MPCVARSRSRSASILTAAALSVVLGSCGFGSVGVGIASSRGNDTTTRTATQLSVVTPDNGQSGRTVLRVGLNVDPAETLRIEAVEFSLRGSNEVFRAATPMIGHPSEMIAGNQVRGDAFARREDKFLRFVWNSHFDLDELQRSLAIARPVTARAVLRVTVRNLNTGQLLTSATDEFFVDQSLVATIGGGGVGDGTNAAVASMLNPIGITNDANGNLYVADAGNHRVRRILAAGGGVAAGIETLVGNGFQGSLPGTFAANATSMNAPVAVVPDDAGNLVIAEPIPATSGPSNSARLRYYERGTGLVSDFLDGFVRVSSLRMAAGQRLYVADEGDNAVWTLDMASVDPVLAPPSFDDLELFGAFTTPAALAVVDTQTETTVYIGERTPRRVMRQRGSEAPTVVAGGGALAAAIGVDARTVNIGEPVALAATATHFFVADLAADRVLCIDATSSVIANIVAQVTVGSVTRALHQPTGLTFANGTLYVVESGEGALVPGQQGHQVVAIATPEVPGAAVTPFACGATSKVVASAIGELSTQTSGITLEQTTAGTG